MQIGGLQKFSLIDYPGLVSVVIFTQGCNFRCPYCHNPELVLPERFGPAFDPEYILDFLKTRTGRIDGVVISGGEPTLQPDLLPYLKRIKALPLKIKLDTNGSRPEVIRQAVAEKLIDFIAMDIKTLLDAYSVVSGVEVDVGSIEKSIEFILNSGIDYQLRTTVVPNLHTAEMIAEIKRWMQSLRANHRWQDFVLSDILHPGFVSRNN